MQEQSTEQMQEVVNIPTPLVVKETNNPYDYLKDLGYSDVEHQGKLIEQMRERLQLKKKE